MVDEYGTIDRMDEERRKEWEALLKEHRDAIAEADRNPAKADLSLEERYQQIEEMRLQHAEIRQQYLMAEAERQRQALEDFRPIDDKAADQSIPDIAAERSREDLAISQFAAEQELARQQEATDTIRAERERGLSAAEGAERLGRSGIKPTFEQFVNADAALFEKRREELRDHIATEKAKEIEATIGGIDDPEMATYVQEERRRIEAEWAKREAERLAAIAREEEARLERTRGLYGRDD